MSNYRVTRFNHITGNKPVGFDSLEDFWEQLELQANLVLEEAKEFYAAVIERDIIEALDGSTDVWYLNEYADDLFKSVGIDVKQAKNLVSGNNDQKFTENFLFAVDSAQTQTFEKQTPSYVSETQYEGTTYYTVLRQSDNKVMKLINHQAPNLIEAFSEEARTYFNIKEEV